MYNLKYYNKGYHPHFIETNKDTYIDNIKVSSPLTGCYDNYEEYNNHMLMHIHTRCLEDVFIKSITTNLKINQWIMNYLMMMI